MELAANEVYINNDGDISERVERLERQRMVDQHSLAQMAASIQTLERHFGSAHKRLVDVEEGLRGPGRDMKIRQEIWDLKDHLEQNIIQSVEITKAAVEPKMQEFQAVMLECQVALTNLHDKETKIENYLKQLDAERPQEGMRVVTGFETMQNEIGSVKEMVKKLESRDSAVPSATVPHAIFTEQMRVGLANLHDKATMHEKGIHDLGNNIDRLSGTQGGITLRMDTLEGQVNSLQLPVAATFGRR